MRKKYDKETMKKACTLYKKGTSLRSILRETGIKSMSSVLFACNPVYRADMVERGRQWRKKNPDRWNEICRNAAKRAQQKNEKD